MEQRKAIMDRVSMVRASSTSKQQVDELLKRAKDIELDARKKERLAAQQCKACFYSSRIGGSAMTTRPCMSCESPEMYGSTATDVLCIACAKEGDLCKRCGGDIEMRERRRNWPEPKVSDQ